MKTFPYRIITQGATRSHEFCDLEALRAWLKAKGGVITGQNLNPRHRVELQNQPKISGLLGPMWDGDAIRYEDQDSYNILST